MGYLYFIRKTEDVEDLWQDDEYLFYARGARALSNAGVKVKAEVRCRDEEEAKVYTGKELADLFSNIYLDDIEEYEVLSVELPEGDYAVSACCYSDEDDLYVHISHLDNQKQYKDAIAWERIGYQNWLHYYDNLLAREDKEV